MARVFVSHASKDRALAREVHQWLIDAGHEVFLAQGLRGGIAVGEQGEQRLHDELRLADAVVCLVTSAYLASRWCTAEVAIARSRGSRLLPVQADAGHGADAVTEIGHIGEAGVGLGEAAEVAEIAGRAAEGPLRGISSPPRAIRADRDYAGHTPSQGGK